MKVGINGFGRIGRAIFKNISKFDDIQIVAINDINPEIQNIVYLLKFDTLYGRFEKDIDFKDDVIIIDGRMIPLYNKQKISQVPWHTNGCDLVIEAAGNHSLLEELPVIIKSGVKKIIVTYSPEKNIDKYLVFGANEDSYLPKKHNIISSSICDSVAITPIYKTINELLTIKNGFLTTLHPWLAYQNLLDGPPKSWGYPNTLYGHYSLGRAATASLILKPTTAISAAEKILPGIASKMSCYSYRVPTPVVGAADLTFLTEINTSKNELISVFRNQISKQILPILYINNEPLVSSDFKGTDYSAIIDVRWLEVVNNNLIKITLWYDNEYGYSRRVVDLARYIFNLEPIMHLDDTNRLS